MLTRQEVINMLQAVSGVMRYTQESPITANNILDVISELERLWKLEDEYNKHVAFLWANGVLKGDKVDE